MSPREFFQTVDSTQDRAIELARSGAPHGTRVVAREQRRGRGRLDREWFSPRDAGLYLSIVLRAPPSPRTLLSIAVGVALRETLIAHTGISPWVKWPNDLVMDDGRPSPRKLAGILIDEVASPTMERAEVVGIGLNVRAPREKVPPEIQQRLTSIEDWVKPPPTLESVETWVADATTGSVARLATYEGRRAVVDECARALYGRGRPVRVDGVTMGRIDTVGTEGELWVVHGAERIAIRAGDVEILR